ncbi:hypothetical protein QWY75_02515 [Pontixanthobacter aestiaquae]|uniref:Porin n=1 Tax=Pontixanthobacter aestiaquae TaxID=1509367 RepID=A0A844ZA53_9SPHN|nr:hypothetical protein [Pontixanthobacter aestiaquae]MDN3645077.1 hypothetical protein [Pontixanthobacter aestiaquae]MXO83923.1 hypothetical protein [Pontixanthobacter aestiaquae]
MKHIGLLALAIVSVPSAAQDSTPAEERADDGRGAASGDNARGREEIDGNFTKPMCDMAAKAIEDVNGFVGTCLGLKKPSQYSSADVAAKFSVVKSGENIEVTPSYTWRWSGLRAKYAKVSVGGFATSDDDGNSTFYDFDDIQNGSGFTVGFEAGLFAPRGEDSNGKIIREELMIKAYAKARRACITEKSMEFKDGKLIGSVDTASAVKACQGAGVWEWVQAVPSRQQEYWKETAGKLYDVDNKNPQFFGGIVYRQAYRTDKYLTPSIITGLAPSTTLSELTKMQIEKEVEPFSIKAYFGVTVAQIDDLDSFDRRFGADEKRRSARANFLGDIGLGAVFSLAYKNDFEFLKADRSQTVCVVEGLVSRCDSFNLNTAYKVKEWTPGLAINVLFPGVTYVPKFGVSARLSYETKRNRFGLQVPISFALDSNDGLTGGVRYFYRSAGTDVSGAPVASENGVGFFIGTKFGLTGH